VEGGLVVTADQLTLCKICSKEVAKSSSTCPHCGAKLKMTTFEKILILIGASFTIYILFVLPVLRALFS